MNIAVIGPEKFRFQDMACIDLALAYRPFGSFTFVPEPKGGEDSTLLWTGSPGTRLEVQVKGASEIAGMEQLLGFLAHFPERQSNKSLLERLMDDPDCHALFILSARCTDEIVPLLFNAPPTAKPAARSVSTALATALQLSLGEYANRKTKKSSKLEDARKANLKGLAKRPLADFETALSKVGLMEKETAESIEVRLHAKLTAERFDSLSIRGALAHCVDVLSAAKVAQTDAIAPILAKLADMAPTSLRPPGYLDRGIEDGFEAHLRDHSALLLAGPPRAGKSWTTHAIAERLQRSGFEVRAGVSLVEADRFLSDAVIKPRAFLLDDPLGQREPIADASAQLAALAGLCERIPANRRLIVAQAEQVLFQVRGTSTLATCAVAGQRWIRLETPSVAFAMSIWRESAQAQGLDPVDVERVARLIERDSSLRDPGALAYLAQSWGEVLPNAADQEIVFQARRDATDFANSLAAQSPQVRRLLTASALATTPAQGAAEQELAYVMQDIEQLPGLQPKTRFVSMLDPDESRTPAPAYTSLAPLDDAQRHGLELLERRRVLVPTAGQFNFTHVYLRAGAQSLVKPVLSSDASAMLAQFRRAIGCASPATSLASARNLGWMRSALREQLPELFKVAYEGTRSVFPATRDECFRFLIDYSQELPKRLQKAIPGTAQSMVVGFEELDTSQGVAFISDQYDLLPDHDSISAVTPFLQAMETGAPLGLDLSLSKRLLGALQADPARLTHAVVRRFLLADEAMVRAAAAQLWIGHERDSDDDILSRVASDQTPAMSVALLKGLADQWHELPAARQEKLLAVLSQHARSPSCASVLFPRLARMNRREEFGTRPPWPIFAALLPTVIAHLPLSVSFRDGRLNSAIDDGIRALPPDALTPALRAWHDRLLKRIGTVVLDESELSVVEPLLEGTSVQFRLPIFEALLDVPDTGTRVVTMRWLINGWDRLQPEERERVQAALDAQGEDRRWLLATVLTRAHPPESLVEAIAGTENALSLSAGELGTRLGAELFAACVHMQAGWPQPLWWYGVHHSSPHWDRILRELAQTPSHPLHPVAFYEIARHGEPGELQAMVALFNDADLWKTFERLLDIKVSTVADWHQSVWQDLLDRLDPLGLLDQAMNRIDAMLDGILEDGSDIVAWLGKGQLADKVARLLPGDLKAMRTLRDLRIAYDTVRETASDDPRAKRAVPQIAVPQIMDAVFDAMLKPIFAHPPRLFGTWDAIRCEARTLGCSDEWYALIDAQRTQTLERHSDLRRQAPGSPGEFTLPAWIDRAGSGDFDDDEADDEVDDDED